MSDLVVTAFTPTVDSGRALRIYGVVRALALHGSVDVLYKSFGAAQPAPEYRGSAGVSLHAVEALRGPGRARAYLRARARGVPKWDARSLSPELAAAAERMADAPGRGRVIADGTIVSTVLRDLRHRRPVVHLSHNVESQLRPGMADYRGRGTARAYARYERRLLEAASECWMVSRRDIEQAHSLAPGARLRYVPNVVDVSAIPVVGPRLGSRRILFLADYSYTPNREALDFLLEAVMPGVWEQLPDAELHLAGHDLPVGPERDPRVVARGFVQDLQECYASVSCVAVPLLTGGGSPLKFIEALAHGLPVVASPTAAAGLELVPGEHFRLADGPDEFARALAEVLSQGGEEMGRRGRLIVEREYSIETLAAALADQGAGMEINR